ncbi:unnamed protein product [Calypogeia fissa]
MKKKNTRNNDKEPETERIDDLNPNNNKYSSSPPCGASVHVCCLGGRFAGKPAKPTSPSNAEPSNAEPTKTEPAHTEPANACRANKKPPSARHKADSNFSFFGILLVPPSSPHDYNGDDGEHDGSGGTVGFGQPARLVNRG